MKLSLQDLPKIQFSLMAAVLMGAIGGTSIYVANGLTRSAGLEKTSAQAERNDFDGKLKRVSSEEIEIKQKSALFKTLQTRGIVGEEQRLEWVELLKDIRDKRRLLDLVYEIAPQRPLDTPSATGYAFHASTMKLQIKLLHEEDLTRLIDDLRQQARALIQVRSCSITRLPRGPSEGAIPAQLQADCSIDWITLRETPVRK